MLCTRLFPALTLAAVAFAQSTAAQQITNEAVAQIARTDTALPDAPSAAQSSATGQDPVSGSSKNVEQGMQGKQTKRILGIIPNFRSVSVGEKLPPISTHDK